MQGEGLEETYFLPCVPVSPPRADSVTSTFLMTWVKCMQARATFSSTYFLIASVTCGQNKRGWVHGGAQWHTAHAIMTLHGEKHALWDGISDPLLPRRMPCLAHLELTALKDNLDGLGTGRCSGHAHDCGCQGAGSLRHCADYKERMQLR